MSLSSTVSADGRHYKNKKKQENSSSPTTMFTRRNKTAASRTNSRYDRRSIFQLKPFLMTGFLNPKS